MNTERFIASRIIKGSGNDNRLSKPIVQISIIGIALGLAVMILTVSIITGFQNEIRNKLIGFGSHIQILNYDNNSSDEQQSINAEQPFLNELKQNPSIGHIQVFASKSGIIKTKTDNEGVVIKGIGADYNWQFIESNLKAGNTFTVSDTGISKNIVISKYLANKLELNIKDKMSIYFLTKKTDSSYTHYQQRVKVFYVSGIYETGFEDFDKNIVLVDIHQIQKLNYWDKNQIGGFEIQLNDFNKIDETGAEVNYLIGQDLIAQTVKERHPSIFSWLDLQDMNAIIVIVLMILVAGINMISALLILILERTNMIGILKALGARNGFIQRVFLLNAANLIGQGLLWGNVLGLGIALIQQHFQIFKLDQTAYYVSVIPININIFHVILLNAGTLFCCLIMLIIPSFIVSKITPVKAIRFS